MSRLGRFLNLERRRQRRTAARAQAADEKAQRFAQVEARTALHAPAAPRDTHLRFEEHAILDWPRRPPEPDAADASPGPTVKEAPPGIRAEALALEAMLRKQRPAGMRGVRHWVLLAVGGGIATELCAAMFAHHGGRARVLVAFANVFVLGAGLIAVLGWTAVQFFQCDGCGRWMVPNADDAGISYGRCRACRPP